MSAREQPRALFSFFICICHFFCVPLQPKVAKTMNESLLLRASKPCNWEIDAQTKICLWHKTTVGGK